MRTTNEAEVQRSFQEPKSFFRSKQSILYQFLSISIPVRCGGCIVYNNQSQRVQYFIWSFATELIYPFALYKCFSFFSCFLIGKVRRTLPYLIKVVSLGKQAVLSPNVFY